MYPTPNELSSYSPAWPCAHFRLAGGVNALAGVLLLLRRRDLYHKSKMAREPGKKLKDSTGKSMFFAI